MKKILVSFLIFGMFLTFAPMSASAKTYTMTDLYNQIETLQKQVTKLQGQLRGLAAGAISPNDLVAPAPLSEPDSVVVVDSPVNATGPTVPPVVPPVTKIIIPVEKPLTVKPDDSLKKDENTEVRLIPVLTTKPLSHIDRIGIAGWGGNITNIGASPITSRGILYSKDSTFATGVITVNTPETSNNFLANAISVPYTNTVYYYKAFAVNGSGRGEGNVLSFESPAAQNAPILTTKSATYPTAMYPTLISGWGGNITSHNGSNITNRGIVYSLNPHPTLSSTIETVGLNTVGASDNFTASNVSPILSSVTYYYRSFATNSSGTAYGNELSLTTFANSTNPTKSKEDNTGNSNLTIGSKGNDVLALQKMLIKKGLLSGTADGSFGKMTAAAVKQFETSNKLVADGIADAKMIALLNSTVGETPVNPCPVDINGNQTPSIKVISPNGGEIFSGINGVTIKWNSCGIPATSNVKITLQDLVGALSGFPVTLSASTPNDGQEFVTFPTAYGHSFKVKIELITLATPPSDVSDNTFSIVPATSASVLSVVPYFGGCKATGSFPKEGICNILFTVKNETSNNIWIPNQLSWDPNTNITIENINGTPLTFGGSGWFIGSDGGSGYPGNISTNGDVYLAPGEKRFFSITNQFTPNIVIGPLINVRLKFMGVPYKTGSWTTNTVLTSPLSSNWFTSALTL